MIRKIKYISIVMTVLLGKIVAQDFHLSMYDAAPLFLNPAMTGLIETKMRAHAQYRTQWGAVAFKPFTTALVSFDMPTKTKWSYGGQISNMRAGLSNYNVLQVIGSGSYLLPIDKNKTVAEQSIGGNVDIGFKTGFGENFFLNINKLSVSLKLSTSAIKPMVTLFRTLNFLLSE